MWTRANECGKETSPHDFADFLMGMNHPVRKGLKTRGSWENKKAHSSRNVPLKSHESLECYSTVTDFARFLGLSTSSPLKQHT